MSREDYVSYELAKALKMVGFDWPCNHYYCAFDNETDVRFWSIHPAQSNNGFADIKGKVIVDAPTLWQVHNWLRTKGWYIDIRLNGLRSFWWYQIWQIKCNGFVTEPSKIYDSYENALEKAIALALELIQDPNIK